MMKDFFSTKPLTILGLALSTLTLHAVDFTWQGGNGDWSDDAKWAPVGGPPNDNTDKAILQNAAGTINLDSNFTIRELGSVGAAAYTISGANTLTFDPNSGTNNTNLVGTGNATVNFSSNINVTNSSTGGTFRLRTIANNGTAALSFNNITVGSIGAAILVEAAGASSGGTLNLNGLVDTTANNADLNLTSINSNLLRVNNGAEIRTHSNRVVRAAGTGTNYLAINGSITAGAGLRVVDNVSLGNTSGAAVDGVALRLTDGANLRLDANNQFNNTVRFDTAGSGTIDLNGNSNSAGILNLGTAAYNLTIDFSSPVAQSLSFADSSGFDWTGSSLDLLGFDFGQDTLRFGDSETGLTADQLSLILLDGAAPSNPLFLDSQGYLSIIPEPSTGFNLWHQPRPGRQFQPQRQSST